MLFVSWVEVAGMSAEQKGENFSLQHIYFLKMIAMQFNMGIMGFMGIIHSYRFKIFWSEICVGDLKNSYHRFKKCSF